MFIWQNFQPAYRYPGWKNRDLGNRASPPSHMNTSFHKGFRGKVRSLKPGQPGQPGSYEEALRVLSSLLSLIVFTTSDDNGKIYKLNVMSEIENNTWARRDTEYLFMCSIRYVTSEPSKHLTYKKKPTKVVEIPIKHFILCNKYNFDKL